MPKKKKKKATGKIVIKIPVFGFWSFNWSKFTILLSKKGETKRTKLESPDGEKTWTFYDKKGRAYRSETSGRGWEEETKFGHDKKGRLIWSETTRRERDRITITKRKFDPISKELIYRKEETSRKGLF